MTVLLRNRILTISGTIGLCLVLLTSTNLLAKSSKRSCSLCERDSLIDVVIPENETLLKELTILAEGVGSTVEILEDGRGYLTQLPSDTVKSLSRRGIRVSPWAPPSEKPFVPIEKDGDVCEEAIVAEPNVPYTGQVTDAVPWVWYSFTPMVTGTHRITLEGSEMDTVLYLYNNCAGDPSQYVFGLGFDPELTLAMEAGTRYYILIESFWYESGNYALLIEETGPANPSDPGAGQTCQEATAADVGETYVGETTASSTQRWYSFTPAISGIYEISLADSTFDTTLTVYDDCEGNAIAYNDDSGASVTSQVIVQMEADTTYYIQIDGFMGWSYGNYVLRIEEYIPVPGESCMFPLDAELNTLLEGSLTESMYEVWYAFTPTESGHYVVSLKGSTFDTILYVYDRCGGYALWQNDDTNDLQSRLSAYMYEGTTYFIAITPWDYVGSYNLRITAVTESASNDTVAGAAPISLASPVHGCTDAATSSLSYSSCSAYDSRDVWYSFTPTSTNFMRLTLQGHDFDTTLSVFDEDRGVELACNDQKNDCTNDSGLSMAMVQGKSYLIRVAGHYDGTGHYTLMLEPVIDSTPNAAQVPNPVNGAEEVPTDVILSWDNWTVPPAMQPARQANVGSKRAKGMGLKGIYGRDDRLDEYQVTDPNILKAGDPTVILMPKDSLSLLPRLQKYDLNDTTTLAEYITYAYGSGMCSDEPFQNQLSAGWCSGFLVAPDLIVTAGHCAGCEGDLEDVAVVFGFTMKDANTPVTRFELDEVYFCQEQVVGQYDIPDWSLIRLDRPVTGHLPARIRRSGAVGEQQPLLMAGYPLGLPLKYDMGATVRDTWQQSYFSANTDSFGGNSGSAVFNLDTLEVEGILVWGNGDFDYDYDAGCVMSLVCPDTGCPTWEYATRIGVLSNAVPCYDVFLGRDPSNLVQVDSGWGAPQFDPDGLEPGQTYYWRIISHNAIGQTVGPVWSFTTAQ